MSHLKSFLACVIGALAVLLFFQAVALADASGSGASVGLPSQFLPSGWAGLVFVAFIGASWALRKWSSIPFFHETAGQVVFGVATLTIPSVLQGLQQHGLSPSVFTTALLGALFSYWSSDNPSQSSDAQKQNVVAMRARRAPQPPPPVRPGSMSILLPLGLALGLATIPSCGTPGGQALAKCELGSLPSAAGAIIANLVAVAFSGGNYQQQLEQAGIQAAQNNAGPQFNCAVQAVSAWMDSTTPRGEVSPARREAGAAFKTYLAAHKPTACGGMPKIEPRCVPLYSAAYSTPPRG